VINCKLTPSNRHQLHPTYEVYPDEIAKNWFDFNNLLPDILSFVHTIRLFQSTHTSVLCNIYHYLSLFAIYVDPCHFCTDTNLSTLVLL